MTTLQQLLQQAYLSDAPAQDPNPNESNPGYMVPDFHTAANAQAQQLQGYNPMGKGLQTYRESQPSLEELLQRMLKTGDPAMTAVQRLQMPQGRGKVDIGGNPSIGQWWAERPEWAKL